MTPLFTQQEAFFIIAWAKEDHLGLASGPARLAQRAHGIHSAVMGQLFARLSTVTSSSQHDLVEGQAPEGPVTWPWPTQEAIEDRLNVLLPQSTHRYLEELGALPVNVT